MVLALADKIDTLTGFFALGKRPKGGSDPFGLRRACLGIIRILLALDVNSSISWMVNLVYPMLSGFKLNVSGEDVVAEVLEFLAGRLRVLWKDDARADILEAALACGVDDVRLARRRLEALAEFQKTEEFEDLAVAFKRASRIVRDAGQLPEHPVSDLLVQDEEKALHEAVERMDSTVSKAISVGDFRKAFNEFRKLSGRSRPASQSARDPGLDGQTHRASCPSRPRPFRENQTRITLKSA
jgi:glycyl-tRNA synthetase beta chain